MIDNLKIIFWNAIQQFRDWSLFVVRGDGGIKQGGGGDREFWLCHSKIYLIPPLGLCSILHW